MLFRWPHGDAEPDSTAGYPSLLVQQNTQRRRVQVSSEETKACARIFIMKRYGDLFPDIVDIDNLRLAHQKARKGKSWQNTVKRVEKNLEENLQALQRSLIDKTFTTSSYTFKQVHEPKTRNIYVLPFYPDRIVQHAVMNVVEPIWDNLFIHHSFACRKGKGQHKGSRVCMAYVRSTQYALKCDVSKFYPSINKKVMSRIVRQKIKCPDTLWLLDDIVHSTEGDTNVPIGNYTSQWLGNLYLNELDQFIKHTLRCKKYIRYCDDFCLFSNDKAQLHAWNKEIERFLWDKLKLTYSKSSVFPVSHGVDFLGYRHFPNKILLRKTTAQRVKRRIRKMPTMVASGRLSKEQATASLQSTKGWLKWANTHNLKLALEIDSKIKEFSA